MTPATLTIAPEAFMGWRIVGVAFTAQFFANAVTLSAFSNFVLPLSESFSVSRATITLGTAIAIGCIGLFSPFVGRWVDRGYARRLMTLGATLSGSGLLLLSQIQDIRLFAWVYGGLVCTGAALFGVMPSMTLVANWFVNRRGFALGITFAGATIASAVAPVAAQYLIDVSGWRTAMQVFGLVVLAVAVPGLAFFVVGRPEEVGQLPDGERASDEPAPVGTIPRASAAFSRDSPSMNGVRILSVQELARDPRLWFLSLGFGLVMTSPIVLLTLLIPYGQSLGLSAQQANLFLIAAMPFSLFGKLALGSLADRAPAKPIIGLVVGMNLLFWLIFYSKPGFNLFLLSGAIYGLGIGGAAPVQGVVMGRCFGRVNFGTANGLGGIVAIFLLIMASLMSSLLQGEQGEGYPTIFLVQACIMAISGLVMVFLRIPSADQSVERPAA